MKLHTKFNINSVRKYPDGTFGAQVITSDADDNQAFYACKVKRVNKFEVELDRSNIHEFIDSRWQTATVSDALAKELTVPMRSLVISYGHLFTKDVSKKKDGSLYSMWSDAIVAVATSVGKHQLKIGEKVFSSRDATSLLDRGQVIIEYRIIGETRTLKLNLTEHPDIAKRLNKQFDVAEAKYMRGVNSRPIGGMSWAAAQDARKEFGSSNRNHRQLQRSRS